MLIIRAAAPPQSGLDNTDPKVAAAVQALLATKVRVAALEADLEAATGSDAA